MRATSCGQHATLARVVQWVGSMRVQPSSFTGDDMKARFVFCILIGMLASLVWDTIKRPFK